MSSLTASNAASSALVTEIGDLDSVASGALGLAVGRILSERAPLITLGDAAPTWYVPQNAMARRCTPTLRSGPQPPAGPWRTCSMTHKGCR